MADPRPPVRRSAPLVRGSAVPPVDAARLIDQVVDYAIIALDGSGTIESWNTGAERLKGYSAAEAIGRSFSMFYTEEDRRAGLPLELLEAARDKGRVEHLGWRIRRDGTRFWGDVIITALHDDAGNFSGFAKVTRDLTAQHDLEASLRRSEERFRLLVGQVVDYAIIALDASGTIESWNAGAERLKGYSAAEAIGRSFSMFYTDGDRRSGLPLQLLDAARREGSVEHTGWRVRKDGTRFWGDVIITALYDDDGVLSGYAKVTRDLTDRKRLEDAQASFFAAIAHDFRTPITAMKGFLELARDAPDPMRADLLRRIDGNADRLLEMMEEMVDYAVTPTLAAARRPERLDLSELVRETVAGIAAPEHADRLVLPTTPVVCIADRAAMERVVTNLVGNALKYAADGPVTVDVSCEVDLVRLTVRDQGRGIATADLDIVFGEFERGSLAEDDGGTGLGLANVKRLVEEHDGQVWIQSTVGEGTLVTVDLPGLVEPTVST